MYAKCLMGFSKIYGGKSRESNVGILFLSQMWSRLSTHT